MVCYPEVKHKIPELFELIIKSDNLQDMYRKMPVVDFMKFRKNKRDRKEFTTSAEKFIQRQKGGTI